MNVRMLREYMDFMTSASGGAMSKFGRHLWILSIAYVALVPCISLILTLPSCPSLRSLLGRFSVFTVDYRQLSAIWTTLDILHDLQTYRTSDY